MTKLDLGHEFKISERGLLVSCEKEYTLRDAIHKCRDTSFRMYGEMTKKDINFQEKTNY